MLPNYAPWGGLEAYQRGIAMTNYLCLKMGKLTFFGLHILSMPRRRKLMLPNDLPSGRLEGAWIKFWW